MLSLSESHHTDMKQVAMSDEEFKKVVQLHYSWYIEAVNALLGAVGKDLYRKMDRNNRRAFVACLDNIKRDYDIRSAARCLVKAFDNELITSYPDALHRSYYDFVEEDLKIRRPKTSRKKAHVKQAVKKIARSRAMKLLKLNLMKKGQSPRKSSYIKKNSPRTSRRVRRNVKPKKYNRNLLKLPPTRFGNYERRKITAMRKRTSRLLAKHVVTNFFSSLWRASKYKTTRNRVPLERTYTKLLHLQDEVAKSRQKANVKNRMLDMVVGKNHPLKRMNSYERMEDLVPRRVVDGHLHEKAKVRQHSNQNTKFLSPRLLSLLPDKYGNSKKLLSPDLFPLYEHNTEESILPLPKILKFAGLDRSDSNAVLELLLEVTDKWLSLKSANDIIEKALDRIDAIKALRLDKGINNITMAIDTAFKRLEKSLQPEQKRHLSERHFAFLEKEQLKSIFAKGLFNVTLADLPFDIDEYAKMNTKEREESLRNTIRLIANDSKAFHRRYKRDVQVLQHTTLAPFMFAPSILTLVVLGPITLSPYIFSPSILSPSVLSPITLSPSLFAPSILSPMVLDPTVLSPQVGDPMVLSPYVLSPIVLSPSVMIAQVLTPYVLSPNVLTPYVMSPLILSPYVLSPDILSPTLLSGSILSPSVLSPAVLSNATLGVDFLSPTFLSK